MKLRNKKTGEIIETGDRFLHMKGRYLYNSLAELNREWEDYEEPKEDGLDHIITLVEAYSNHDSERYPKEIVEKLKAWKRLKDTYHIRFDLDFVKNTISFTYQIDGTLHSAVNEERIVFEDMKTFFGGEE